MPRLSRKTLLLRYKNKSGWLQEPLIFDQRYNYSFGLSYEPCNTKSGIPYGACCTLLVAVAVVTGHKL